MDGVKLKVICLGTGGYYPTANCQTASYIIPSLGIVFDCGTGFYRAIDYIETNVLDIFLSHIHHDHVCAIGFIHKLITAKKLASVRIHALEEYLPYLETFLNSPFGSIDKEVSFHPLAKGFDLLDNGAIVRNFSLKHTDPCSGYRVEYQGYAISYVTDTNTNLESPYCLDIAGSNLLLHECYYSAKSADYAQKQGHTDSKNLTEVCIDTNIHRIVTIHHNPLIDPEIIIKEIQKKRPQAIAGKDFLEIEL